MRPRWLEIMLACCVVALAGFGTWAVFGEHFFSGADKTTQKAADPGPSGSSGSGTSRRYRGEEPADGELRAPAGDQDLW